MSKGAFRSMLGTTVTVKQPVQYFTFDKVPKEAVWVDLADSPVQGRISQGAGRTGANQPAGELKDNPVFGQYPEADFVLYYDADDITLEGARAYRFEWEDDGGTTRVCVSLAPPQAMGGPGGFMRVRIQEQFRYTE